MALTDSLISYWKMDETSGTRYDSHGTNHLTDNNSVGSLTGKINSSAYFGPAPTTKYLNHIDSSDFDVGDIDFTFSLWFLTYINSPYPILISKRTSAEGSDTDYVIYIDGTTSKAAVEVGASGYQSILSDVISTYTWYHLVVSYDASANIISLILNNGAPVTYNYSGGGNVNSASFEIGSCTSQSLYIDGLIDEVGFWKRVLTSDERTQLYNSGNGLSYDNFNASSGFSLAKLYNNIKGFFFNMSGWFTN